MEANEPKKGKIEGCKKLFFDAISPKKKKETKVSSMPSKLDKPAYRG